MNEKTLKVEELGVSEHFGESSLYFNSVRIISVKAEEDSLLLCLSKTELTSIFGD
jgi:hypothetical protein